MHPKQTEPQETRVYGKTNKTEPQTNQTEPKRTEKRKQSNQTKKKKPCNKPQRTKNTAGYASSNGRTNSSPLHRCCCQTASRLVQHSVGQKRSSTRTLTTLGMPLRDTCLTRT